jgi:hypothetical protein
VFFNCSLQKELLKKDIDWRDFPFPLLDCQNVRQFCSKYERVLLPVVVWCGKSNNSDEAAFVNKKLSDISNEVGKDVRGLLVDNFADFVSFFLPTFVAADKNPEILSGVSSKKQITRATTVSKILETILTTDKYFALLSESMPEVLSNILKQVQDVDHLSASLADNKMIDKNLIDNLLVNTQVQHNDESWQLMF